ncbi:MAG: hypothetical protein WDZ44_01810 [Candidatus Spechtbacterales bacterium]
MKFPKIYYKVLIAVSIILFGLVTSYFWYDFGDHLLRGRSLDEPRGFLGERVRNEDKERNFINVGRIRSTRHDSVPGETQDRIEFMIAQRQEVQSWFDEVHERTYEKPPFFRFGAIEAILGVELVGVSEEEYVVRVTSYIFDHEEEFGWYWVSRETEEVTEYRVAASEFESPGDFREVDIRDVEIRLSYPENIFYEAGQDTKELRFESFARINIEASSRPKASFSVLRYDEDGMQGMIDDLQKNLPLCSQEDEGVPLCVEPLDSLTINETQVVHLEKKSYVGNSSYYFLPHGTVNFHYSNPIIQGELKGVEDSIVQSIEVI